LNNIKDIFIVHSSTQFETVALLYLVYTKPF
jgi:hypothetical protein